MAAKPIYYLGTPYTHSDPKIRHFRYQAVTKMAYTLITQGRLVFSPITHNIPIDLLGFDGNYVSWMDFDHGMLSRCDGLIVFKLPGWETSKGLSAEIEFAKKINLPIEELIPSAEFLDALQRQCQEETQAERPLAQLLQNINQMSIERDWEQFHSPKNLAMSLQAEAAEVAEHFIWLTLEQSAHLDSEKKQMISEELGDVLINLTQLSDKLNIDLLDVTFQKIEKIKHKYTIEKHKGLSKNS